MARERKSKSGGSRKRRKMGARVKKSATGVPVPLRFRAAFANYLLHGMTPAQARMRIAAEMTEAADVQSVSTH